jgi:hypothetical protein
MLQTLLGLVPAAAIDTLVVDPVLPEWLPEIVLRDLRVGAARVSIRFWRERDGTSAWEVLHRQGTLHVIRQPPPESLSATGIDRAAGILESVFR